MTTKKQRPKGYYDPKAPKYTVMLTTEEPTKPEIVECLRALADYLEREQLESAMTPMYDLWGQIKGYRWWWEEYFYLRKSKGRWTMKGFYEDPNEERIKL